MRARARATRRATHTQTHTHARNLHTRPELQDARIARETEDIKLRLKEYDDALEKYIPVLMAQGQLLHRVCVRVRVRVRGRVRVRVVGCAIARACVRGSLCECVLA